MKRLHFEDKSIDDDLKNQIDNILQHSLQVLGKRHYLFFIINILDQITSHIEP